jgi:hypothetical protein
LKSQNPTPGKTNSKRLTFIILGLAVLAAACTYAYSVYTEYTKYEAVLPRLRLQTLIRDVRRFESLAGRVPRTFDEIERLVWKHKDRTPTFDKNGTGYALANYFYVLHAVDDSRLTIWAIPLGQRRDEASTHFIIVTSERVLRWRGAALGFDEVGTVSSNPTASELAALGLVRQPDETPAGKPSTRRRLTTSQQARREPHIGMSM